jgi:F-type H+-transporting ATPase subunit b
MSLLSVSTSSTLFSSERTAVAHFNFSEGAVNVDLDASLFVQIGLFVVLLVILKPLLFDPMLKLFEEREKRIEGTKAEASKENERSAKAKAKYDTIVGKGRDAGAVERDHLRVEGMKKEAEIMARVRAETASTVENGRAASAAEARSARNELTAEAAQLGRSIASRVLGREVSP